MSIVAGIDPSLTSAGVAVLENGRPIRIGRFGFPGHKGASYQTRSRRVRKQVVDVTRFVGRPDLAVIEEHPYAIRVSAGEFDRTALWHGIYGQLDAQGIPIVVMNNMTAKVWITGSGSAKKRDIVATVNEWWGNTALFEPIDCDDIADALGLATIGAFHLGDPMPFEPKPRHTTGLEKVQWP
ncbi:crossover junction endodeoxyribonuclease RuvC [Mycolicibacterium goodii]|uniref:crossover junction endodeoxyribonuclease RuvC n=1 Tax=Mycolicibacterium goodii TaxID=134601 RepID=UPI001BDBF8E9|nr:crossover junction endodeoxyribonuclease RuvC [Mycolicibacterium goodii]MBU8819564.1 crossover junction endodeoxyribonuclease RuvC [Mycolicibacterium goodii]